MWCCCTANDAIWQLCAGFNGRRVQCVCVGFFLFFFLFVCLFVFFFIEQLIPSQGRNVCQRMTEKNLAWSYISWAITEKRKRQQHFWDGKTPCSCTTEKKTSQRRVTAREQIILRNPDRHRTMSCVCLSSFAELQRSIGSWMILGNICVVCLTLFIPFAPIEKVSALRPETNRKKIAHWTKIFRILVFHTTEMFQILFFTDQNQRRKFRELWRHLSVS